MKKDTSWGNVADWYGNHVAGKDSYHQKVILPNLLRLLDIKKGMSVLDVACGSGFFTQEFAKAGASAQGIDISPELVALAEKQFAGVKFSVAPAHSFPSVKSESIDAVTLILAIQNIREVKETFAECSRVLKKGGRMYVVMNHPAFRIPGSSSWGWDEKEKTQYRRVDQYLSEKTVQISMHPGSKPEEQTVSFHRPLQHYMKFIRGAGFAATRIEEWISHRASEKGPRQAEEDRMRKEIPLFMAIELVKFGV